MKTTFLNEVPKTIDILWKFQQNEIKMTEVNYFYWMGSIWNDTKSFSVKIKAQVEKQFNKSGRTVN